MILNEQHKEDLLKRGLTLEQIEGQRYRSVPLFGIRSLVRKLQDEGLVVKGVPGFYEGEKMCIRDSLRPFHCIRYVDIGRKSGAFGYLPAGIKGS